MSRGDDCPWHLWLQVWLAGFPHSNLSCQKGIHMAEKSGKWNECWKGSYRSSSTFFAAFPHHSLSSAHVCLLTELFIYPTLCAFLHALPYAQNNLPYNTPSSICSPLKKSFSKPNYSAKGPSWNELSAFCGFALYFPCGAYRLYILQGKSPSCWHPSPTVQFTDGIVGIVITSPCIFRYMFVTIPRY